MRSKLFEATGREGHSYVIVLSKVREVTKKPDGTLFVMFDGAEDDQMGTAVRAHQAAPFLAALREAVNGTGEVKRLLRSTPVGPQEVKLPADWPRKVTCPDCDGSGSLGKASDGRLIACEKCGGHEDSLGRGFFEEDLPDPELMNQIQETILQLDRHASECETGECPRIANELNTVAGKARDRVETIQKIIEVASEIGRVADHHLGVTDQRAKTAAVLVNLADLRNLRRLTGGE